jgi:hypothetical protein
MRTMLGSIRLLCLTPSLASAGQIIAGTSEDRMFQRITVETNPDAKLQTLIDFEKQFPQSKVLPDVYLMVIDSYRQKGDRVKVIEYGEKVLKIDNSNVTAMMILSRNYSLERKNLDRAVALAQQAVDLIAKMKGEPTPVRYSDTQWKDYLLGTEGAARSILEYAKSVRGQ